VGFIRRFAAYPGDEVAQQTGGVDIIDLAPPGFVQGVSTGVAALVGEFVDVTSGVQVTVVTGVSTVSSKYRPVQIRGGLDQLTKLGGADPTIGDFGATCGNGFAELRNKQFSGLVVVPINLASVQAVRLFRHLPTNKTATNPQPILPVQAATVLAGTMFKSGTNRFPTAMRAVFTADVAYQTGIDGTAAPAGLPAATQTFSSAGAHFLGTSTLRAVQVGDILVLGVLGAAGAQGTDANTYRVTAVTNDTTLVIEQMDGSNFTVANWVASVVLAWRLHPSASADTAASVAAASRPYGQAAGYTLAVRALDVSLAPGAVSQQLAPSPAAPVETATTWDPLSSLTLLTQNTVGIVFDPTRQTPNVNVTTATDSLAAMDTEYTSAINSLLSQDFPARQVSLVWAARKRPAVRTALQTHVTLASGQGISRTCMTAPQLNIVALGGTAAITEDLVLGDPSPGVGASRDERQDFCWPSYITSVPEFSGASIQGADGSNVLDGTLDMGADGLLASVLSMLAPERDPGQSASPVADVMNANVLALGRGISGLQMSDYILFNARGVTAIRFDVDLGLFIFETASTTSADPTRQSIPRRRFADFAQDSLAKAYKPFVKLPISRQFTDGLFGETDSFLQGMLSPNNPAFQRILGYTIDEKSGNTRELLKKGIYVIIVNVEMLGIARKIVLQTTIGNGVLNIVQAA
jgi:hypothetical protein